MQFDIFGQDDEKDEEYDYEDYFRKDDSKVSQLLVSDLSFYNGGNKEGGNAEPVLDAAVSKKKTDGNKEKIPEKHGKKSTNVPQKLAMTGNEKVSGQPNTKTVNVILNLQVQSAISSRWPIGIVMRRNRLVRFKQMEREDDDDLVNNYSV